MKAFLESPSNRTGLALWLGTAIVALLQYVATRQAPPSADLLGIAIGLVKIIQPENSVTVAQLEKAIADVRAAIATKSPGAIEQVIADGAQLVSDVTTTPATKSAPTGA